MSLDKRGHKSLLSKLTIERDQLRAVLVGKVGIENPNSSVQVGKWLEDVLSNNVGHWPRTRTGRLKTGKDDIQESLHLLPDDYRHVAEAYLLPFKKHDKLLSTFGPTYSEWVHPITDRVHAALHLAGAVTGRMSCSIPNLQQIPRAENFRSLLKAQDGYEFVIGDYSQMELRVAAELSEDRQLRQAFNDGGDIHLITAARLCSKPIEEVTDTERQLAKAVNFGEFVWTICSGATQVRCFDVWRHHDSPGGKTVQS